MNNEQKDTYDKKSSELYNQKRYLLEALKEEKEAERQGLIDEHEEKSQQERGNTLTRTLIKPNSNNSSSGFVNVLILTLLVGFISGITFMLAYNFIK